MNPIYTVSGTLNKNFVGQISYTVCLDKTYEEMAISFVFDKQRYSIITDDLKQWLIAACDGKYNMATATDAQLISTLKNMKTELQLVVTMNDTFIGGIHNQDNPKHLYFSANEATEGCIPQPSVNGVIRITIIAFSVIEDDTHYDLTLSAR
ncbi:MAG: DUF6669 family protein [Cellulosilyticaceae bacterium]